MEHLPTPFGPSLTANGPWSIKEEADLRRSDMSNNNACIAWNRPVSPFVPSALLHQTEQGPVIYREKPLYWLPVLHGRLPVRCPPLRMEQRSHPRHWQMSVLRSTAVAKGLPPAASNLAPRAR
jgi:hypothetical protein